MTLALLGAAALPAAEIRLHFTALERFLAEQVFTHEGRKYLRGHPGSRCAHAFLERPSLAGAGGDLLIRARFSGRTALNVFGQCVGLGDAFDVTILAAPRVQDGKLAFQNVRIQPAKSGFYARRVAAALRESLERDLRFDLHAEARRLLDRPRGQAAFAQELSEFRVQDVRVAPEAIILRIEFTLAVR